MKGRFFVLLVVVLLLTLPTVALADGICPCPGDTVLVAKFEYDEGTGTYIQTEGEEGVVAIGEGADASGGLWTSTIEIRAVVVKGGTNCSTEWYNPSAVLGTFSNGDLPPNPGGGQPDISGLTFCKVKPTAVMLATFDARNARSAERPVGFPWLAVVLGLAVVGGYLVLMKRKH